MIDEPHRWTHNICGTCWQKKFEFRQPVKVTPAQLEICCFCGADTEEGIYTREDPKLLDCSK